METSITSVQQSSLGVGVQEPGGVAGRAVAEDARRHPQAELEGPALALVRLMSGNSPRTAVFAGTENWPSLAEWKLGSQVCWALGKLAGWAVLQHTLTLSMEWSLVAKFRLGNTRLDKVKLVS